MKAFVLVLFAVVLLPGTSFSLDVGRLESTVGPKFTVPSFSVGHLRRDGNMLITVEGTLDEVYFVWVENVDWCSPLFIPYPVKDGSIWLSVSPMYATESGPRSAKLYLTDRERNVLDTATVVQTRIG